MRGTRGWVRRTEVRAKRSLYGGPPSSPSVPLLHLPTRASKYKVNTAKLPTDDLKVPSRVMNVRSNSKVIAMFSNVSVF